MKAHPWEILKQRGEIFFTSLPGAMLLIAGYGFAHIVLRLSASWNLGENDPLSLLRTQNLEILIASGLHPFDVLTFTLKRILGENALVFQILRYSLLAFSLILVFLISRLIMKSGFWALLTVEAYALIYQISWRLHEGFTYPLITILAVSGTFYAIFRQGRDCVSFILLGLFLGLGLSSGIWYWVFLSCLYWALVRDAKSFTLLPGSLRVLLSIATIFSSCFLVLEIFGDWPVYESAFSGALGAGTTIIAFLSPLLPILALIFWRQFFQIIAGETVQIRIIRHMTFWVVIGLVVAGAMMGSVPYPEHALMPVFFLTPIWLIDRLRRCFPADRSLRLFMGVCVSLMAVAFGARAANFYILDPVCTRCYFAIPFDQLASQLALKFDLDHRDRIVVSDPRLAGHLIAFWPRHPKPFVVWPVKKVDFKQHQPKQTLAIWGIRTPQSTSVKHKQIKRWLHSLGATSEDADRALQNKQMITVNWPHLWRELGYRKSKWGFVLLNAT